MKSKLIKKTKINKHIKSNTKKHIKSKNIQTNYILNGGSNSIVNTFTRQKEIIQLMKDEQIIVLDETHQIEDINIIVNELKINKNISKLNIMESNITDESMKILSDELKNNKTLTTLDFRSNNITDKGASYLVEALNMNKSIESMNLIYNNLTDITGTLILDLLESNNNITINDITLLRNNISDKIIQSIDNTLRSRTYIIKLFTPRLSSLPEMNEPSEHDIIKNKIEFMKTIIEFNEESKMSFDKKIKQLFYNDFFFNIVIKNNYDSGIQKIQTLDRIDESNVISKVSLHGKTLSSFFKLPKNVNIVFLSPVSYITCGVDLEYTRYIESNIEGFLKNPSCFNKNYFFKLLSESVIYYGGQYCINTRLSQTEHDHVTGIQIYDKDTKQFSKNSDFFIDKSKSFYISLDLFIKKYFSNMNNKHINYTIFFTSCRELEYQSDKNNLVFYENTIKLLNYSIYYDYNFNTINKITELNNYKEHYKNVCISNVTHFDLNESDSLLHTQLNKNNNNIKQNNLKSSQKINITDASKIYLTDYTTHVYSKFFNKDDIKTENDKPYIYVKNIIEFIDNNQDLPKNKLYEGLYSIFLKWKTQLIDSNSSIHNTGSKFNKSSLVYFNLIKYIVKPKLFLEFIFYYLNIIYMNDTTSKYIYMRILNILIKNVPEINILDEIIINQPIHYDGFEIILEILKNNTHLTSLDLQYSNMNDDNIQDLIMILLKHKSKHKTKLKKLNVQNNTISQLNLERLNSILPFVNKY